MLAKIQKSLILVSLVSMALAVVMAIAGVVGAPIFTTPFLLAILLTLATISVAGFFSNSALDVYNKKKAFSIVALSLLGLSSLLGLINFWSFFKMPDLFARITGIVAVSSVFIVIMMTTNAKLCGKMKALQFTTFGFISVIDLVIILAFCSVNLFTLIGAWFTTAFVIVCLIAFALLCSCSILAKRVEKDAEVGTIRIKKSEYDALVKENAELKAENETLKAENEKLKAENEELKQLLAKLQNK